MKPGRSPRRSKRWILPACETASSRQTRTQRGRRLRRTARAVVDFERVKREQAATAQIRELVASADMHVLPAIDTADLTQRASIGTTLGATELRAVAEAHRRRRGSLQQDARAAQRTYCGH